MKIVFWSEQEKAGTTFNMTAVASAAAMMCPMSIAVVSGGYHDKDLEKNFFGESRTSSHTELAKSEINRTSSHMGLAKSEESRISPYAGLAKSEVNRTSSHTGLAKSEESRISPYAGLARSWESRISPYAELTRSEESRTAEPAGFWKTEEKRVAEQTGMKKVTGLDCLLHKKDRIELTEQLVKANMKPIIQGRMYCLPCCRENEQEWWYKDKLFARMKQVVEAVENCFELVFMDCGSRKDDFSRKMLEEADVCVLNMSQESELIGEYYRSHVRLSGKVFFLVGKYFEEGVYTRLNLQRIYRIEAEKIGAMPYNSMLHAAGRTGKAEGCIRNYFEQEASTEFAQELRRTTRLILKLAGVEEIEAQPFCEGQMKQREYPAASLCAEMKETSERCGIHSSEAQK